MLGWDAAGEVQPRQRTYLQRLGNQAVHKSCDRLRSGPGQEKQGEDGLPRMHVDMAGNQENGQQGRQGHDGHVKGQMPFASARASAGAVRRHAKQIFKPDATVANQVKACCALSCCRGQATGYIKRRSDNRLGHFALGSSGLPRQPFH